MVGNVGDGEAVLCRGEHAVHMSPVHNPGRTDESRRILDANGWVTTEQVSSVHTIYVIDCHKNTKKKRNVPHEFSENLSFAGSVFAVLFVVVTPPCGRQVL